MNTAQVSMFEAHSTRLPVGEIAQVGPPPAIMLRDYQRDALTAIAAAEGEGIRRQMVVLPCGSGKTILFASLIAERRKRALILCHRDELIDQAVKKVRAVMPGCPVGVVQAEQNDYWSPVVVASVQTLARDTRLEPVVRQPFGLVIADECHHSSSPTWRKIIQATNAGNDDGPLLVGVTATPDRADGVRLDDIFNRIVYTKSIIEMIAEGYLSDVVALRIQLDLDLDHVKTSHGDYQDASLEQALSLAEQPAMTALAIAENAKDRQSIVFCASVALAEQTRDELLALNMRAETVSGETPRAERRAILSRFQRGMTQVVTNCAVITEGFDSPTTDCVVMARPTKSRALDQQAAGRCLRPFPGKKNALIIDVVGVTESLDLQTTSSLIGRDFSVTGAASEHLEPRTSLLEEVHKQGSLFVDPQTGKLLVLPVADLFGRSRFTWQRADDQGTWQMPLDETFSLAIVPGTSGWDVVKVRTGKLEGAPDIQIVQQCLDGAIVHGYAEEYARKHSAKWLADKRAPWRERPADMESKQVAMAVRMGIDLHGLRNAENVLTKGAVSDAINSALVARKVRSYAKARRRAA
ncbi:MAG: DEAD/DEAH box helicase [Rhodanobacteraceae bacterium]|nr:DEAD/DEAH box helicase [Rhodanobacteraceae bacterium]